MYLRQRSKPNKLKTAVNSVVSLGLSLSLFGSIALAEPFNSVIPRQDPPRVPISLPQIIQRERRTGLQKGTAVEKGEEGNNVLILPRVVQEFVGHWGGHLYLLSSAGAFRPRQSSPTSLEFGQRSDGTVFVRTAIWGQPSQGEPVATAQVVDPRKIKIRINHSVINGSDGMHVVQTYSLILKHDRVLDCLESVLVYGDSGNGLGYPYDQPKLSANYHGALYILKPEEANDLKSELLSEGYVPEVGVEGQRNFGSQ